MGKTAFSGPVYGAKETLWSVGPIAASTGAVAVCAGTIIPTGEDWYGTELVMFRNSTGSTNLVMTLIDDSTTVGTVGVGGSSATAASAITVLPTDGGEFEGTKLAGGSTLTLSHSSHAGPNINLFVAVHGFRRFNFTSTRAL